MEQQQQRIPGRYITVGVRVLLFNSRNQVLLGRRLDTEDKLYGTPGGHLEFGEEFAECAQRELDEELDLKIEQSQIKYLTTLQNNKVDQNEVNTSALWDIAVTDINGRSYTRFRDLFQNQLPLVTIIVNVASSCLEELYQTYSSRGLGIIGFPCNQFLGQEGGSNSEIQQFVCQNFKATFPLMEKVEVNGGGAHPIFKHLKSQAGFNNINIYFSITHHRVYIGWNFGKFLVDQKGKVLEYYGPMTNPFGMISSIEKALGISETDSESQSLKRQPLREEAAIPLEFRARL